MENTSWECGIFYVKPTDIITQSSDQLNGLIHMENTSWECCPFYVGLTHYSSNNNNCLNANHHRSYCHSAGNLFLAGNLFCAGTFFRAGRTFRAETPVSLGILRSVYPARFPLAFPWLYPNIWSHVYPERAGIPNTRGGLSLLPRIFRRNRLLWPN